MDTLAPDFALVYAESTEGNNASWEAAVDVTTCVESVADRPP